MRRLLRALYDWSTRVNTRVSRHAATFGDLWRRSLQVRVVVSTLALSFAVVFVLGMVLLNEITTRLIDTKETSSVEQTEAAVRVAERELAGVNVVTDAVRSRLTSAANRLTSTVSVEDNAGTTVAGAFEPVIAYDGPDLPVGEAVYTGPYEQVPADLRRFVQQDKVAVQIYTVDRDGNPETFMMVGAPVTSASSKLQLYLLFPLAAEQRTVSVVQGTLLVGGVVLLLLLAGIANLVTRQVVRPVRRAADAAERFADGDLDQRLPVAGEDDVAKLAESYNAMAESIQRQFRQLEEFGQLQRRFTSDVSHELRTPLTTVRMAADVLHASRAQFPTGLARSTELLVDELDRFESLLGDLLEISRLDAGVEELVADFTDLRAIARRAVESVRVIADTSGSRIELDLPAEEVIAEVEARRVERILRNLLANAVDHGEGRPVSLRMACDEDAVAVVVSDHGVGLRPGEADLVFNRFWRADPARTRHSGGTGLGLAISVEDARLHGGSLQAWGEPGVGASFRLTLPREQSTPLNGRSPLPLFPDEEPVKADIPERSGLIDADQHTEVGEPAR